MSDSGQDRWLRFFNRQIYAANPGLYAALDTATLGIWWRLVRRALDYVPAGGRVLEVGFGPGKLLAQFAAQSDFCAGIDLARGMCHLAQQRLTREGITAGITQGDALRLPFPPGTFDTVVSTFAVSGIPDGASVIAEMARVAAPAGRVVIADIGLPADGNAGGVFLARLWERMGDTLHDLPALMEGAGLRVTTCDEYGPGRHIRAVVGQRITGQ
jgi:SAM-dependent methyltransferase